MEKARRLLADIMTPSARDESVYLFIVIAIGHAMLGAALSWGGLAVGAVYWIVKERGDLKRGGAYKDGLFDTAFVIIGIAYEGPIWWPILVIVSAGVCGLMKK